MEQGISEKQAKLTELKRELVKSVVQSRYWNSKTSTYAAPTRAIPHRVKRLIVEIEALEKEMLKKEVKDE